MQAPTQNAITQTQHLLSKAVDYNDEPDVFIYAPEDATFDSYQQRGSGRDDAGLALRIRGATGLHQFAHTEETYFKGGACKRGQKIAKMGYTGYVRPPGIGGRHLHYTVLTPSGYVYPPNLVNQAFIKLGDTVMPTEQNVRDYFITYKLGNPTQKQIDYYKARPWTVLASDVADTLLKLLKECRASKPTTDAEKKLSQIKVLLG